MPLPLQTAKHRVLLRVRASAATWSRDEAFLKGWTIVTAGKSGGSPARQPRGLSQAVACENRDEDAECFIAHERPLIARTDGHSIFLNEREG